MEIRVLRYFLTVVREEGINRAAEALHITQPTLSRQLSQLEREVGVKLFNRGAKKITLTNEGILLRRRAEEILASVDRTEQELIEQDEQVEGRVVITAKDLENTSLILPRRNNVQNELTNWLGDSFQESNKYKWCFDGSKWFGIFSCNRRFSSIFGQRENYLSSSISAAHLKQCAGVEKTTAVLSCGNKIY